MRRDFLEVQQQIHINIYFIIDLIIYKAIYLYIFSNFRKLFYELKLIIIFNSLFKINNFIIIYICIYKIYINMGIGDWGLGIWK